MKPGEGFNAATGEYRDLVKAGVIDPTMVTRSALQNAASIAKNILTTECVVAEMPEKEPDGRHARRWHGRHDVTATVAFGSPQRARHRPGPFSLARYDRRRDPRSRLEVTPERPRGAYRLGDQAGGCLQGGSLRAAARDATPTLARRRTACRPARHGARARRGARPVGARPRVRGAGAAVGRAARAHASRSATATRSRCPRCAARRSCSWRGPRGEDAASTCPCGRSCEPSCIRRASRSSPSRSTSGGAEAAGPWIDPAKPEHPSLIDEAHLLDELLGVVNVPDRRLDRRAGHDRAPARARLPRPAP